MDPAQSYQSTPTGKGNTSVLSRSPTPISPYYPSVICRINMNTPQLVQLTNFVCVACNRPYDEYDQSCADRSMVCPSCREQKEKVAEAEGRSNFIDEREKKAELRVLAVGNRFQSPSIKEIDQQMLATHNTIRLITSARDRELTTEMQLRSDLAQRKYVLQRFYSLQVVRSIAEIEEKLHFQCGAVIAAQNQLNSAYGEMIELRKQREAVIKGVVKKQARRSPVLKRELMVSTKPLCFSPRNGRAWK